MTDQPNRAPLGDKPEFHDNTNAAAIVADEDSEREPGGGGLGGASAAEAAEATRVSQAATPSNPNSPAVGGDAGSLKAQQEAKHESDAAEPKPL